MKTFGELTREEKIELVTAWIDGAVIEYVNFPSDEWEEDTGSQWLDGVYYRIKPKKPSINWDHVHPDYKWLAVDRCGLAAVFENEPKFDCECWVDGGEWVEAKVFKSFKSGTCDCKDSLVERPKK